MKVLIIATGLLLAGCASAIHRGSVAMKVSDSTAHVALNKNEVKVGDHVELYANKCNRNKEIGELGCEKVSKGHGVVTAVLNDSYSEVKFENGVSFNEGDFIEKHTH